MLDVTAVLTAHYESCLAAYGPTPRGMDWSQDESRLAIRFRTIGRAIGADRPSEPMSLLDAGCGCGLLLEHIQREWPGRWTYFGVDASSKMIQAARQRHPRQQWMVGDIADPYLEAPNCDWVVANGLLTERRDVPHDRMVNYAKRVLCGMFGHCTQGLVFNVLSSHVNYRSDVLFYWDAGEVLAFCANELSRHVTIYHDTSLYEYFCCVRRAPADGAADGT